MSSLLLNYFLTAPRHTFTIAEPTAAVTEVVLLLVAVAVAVLVDGAAKRAREARLASQEAELLTLFAGSVLRGADLETLLERVRETYSQRAVSMLREHTEEDRATAERDIVASVGTDPCATVDSADTAIEVGDDEFWMLLAGTEALRTGPPGATAVATQAAGLVRQRELAEEASRTEAIVRADELRRSLLSAVSHDLRTPLAAAKVAVSSLRAERRRLLRRGHRRIAGHHRGVHRPAHRAGGKPARFVAAGRRRDPPGTAPGVPGGSGAARVGQYRQGGTGFFRSAIDRVKVDVGDAVVMADAGLLERVLANLIDNALRYAPECVVRVNAGRVGDRVLINVIDEGPGIPHGAEEQIFEAFQRLGDHDNTTGVGLECRWRGGFVEAMGGTIQAGDTPGGAGLTVVVDLAAPQETHDPGAGDRRRAAHPARAANQPDRARVRGDHRARPARAR